jgi:hypothetical protein
LEQKKKTKSKKEGSGQKIAAFCALCLRKCMDQSRISTPVIMSTMMLERKFMHLSNCQQGTAEKQQRPD